MCNSTNENLNFKVKNMFNILKYVVLIFAFFACGMINNEKVDAATYEVKSGNDFQSYINKSKVNDVIKVVSSVYIDAKDADYCITIPADKYVRLNPGDKITIGNSNLILS